MSEEQKIRIDKTLAGKILDIGGGGEGVISRVYRQQVTAIDNLQEELNEAPDICTKRVSMYAKKERQNGHSFVGSRVSRSYRDSLGLRSWGTAHLPRL